MSETTAIDQQEAEEVRLGEDDCVKVPTAKSIANAFLPADQLSARSPNQFKSYFVLHTIELFSGSDPQPPSWIKLDSRPKSLLVLRDVLSKIASSGLWLLRAYIDALKISTSTSPAVCCFKVPKTSRSPTR